MKPLSVCSHCSGTGLDRTSPTYCPGDQFKINGSGCFTLVTIGTEQKIALVSVRRGQCNLLFGRLLPVTDTFNVTIAELRTLVGQLSFEYIGTVDDDTVAARTIRYIGES